MIDRAAFSWWCLARDGSAGCAAVAADRGLWALAVYAALVGLFACAGRTYELTT